MTDLGLIMIIVVPVNLYSVQRVVQAHIGFILQQNDFLRILVQIALCNGVGVIRGAVVAQHKLPVRKGLHQNGVNGLRQRGGAVINAHDNRYFCHDGTS